MPAATQAKPPPTAQRAPGTEAAPAALLVSALAIPGRPEHVQSARKFTTFMLGMHGHDDGTAALLVTELVTNSLDHSDSGRPGGIITVTVAITPGEVLIEVTDDGGKTRPAPRPASRLADDAEDGRGLRLVQELADDWGYYGRKGWLVTWFRLHRSAVMTTRHEHRPLTSYPPGTLAALRTHVTALLRHEDMLPADMCVKLDILRDDIGDAIRRSAPRSPTFTPHPATARKGIPS